MDENTCKHKTGDVVKLVDDAETEYLVVDVYPSKLQLSAECKYDLLKLPKDKIVLKGIPDSKIR